MTGTTSKLWITLLAAALLSCGGEEPSGGGGGDAGGGGSVGGCPKVSLGAEPTATAVNEYKVAVSVLGETYQLNGRLIQPSSCTKSAPCPLVVVVPDREVDAMITYTEPARYLADRAQVNVALFNLPGTGVGGFKAKGDNDYGGTHHLTAVKEVMRLLRERDEVDQAATGYISLGYGLVPTAAALKTFGANSLKSTAFLIDVEGPVDRCAASQAPEQINKGIGPDNGPGTSDTACHIDDDITLAEAFPGATDDKPGSVVCATGAWPITKTGEDCTSGWWVGREPATALRSIRTRYQRLQFSVDHRQPTRWSSRVAISAAFASKGCPYVGLNDMPPCQSPLSDEICDGLGKGQSCWLGAGLGDGLAPGDFGGEGWCEVTTEALFALVLPKYVKRMLDLEQFPNCKG